jgi:uncharacterized membrane protein YkoI
MLLSAVALAASFAVSQPAFADDNESEHKESGNSEKGDHESSNTTNTDDGDFEGSDDTSGSEDSSPVGAQNLNSLSSAKPGQKHSSDKGKVLNQDEARAVISKGNAASLPLLLAFIDNNYPGQVLDVRLRKVNGNYIYDVKMLTKFIMLKTVSLDAQTLLKF